MADRDDTAGKAGRRRLPVSEPRNHFFADVDASPSRQRFFHIHRTLRDRIALLHYPPGTRLDIDAIAEEFDVSRTPIRSVLQRLEYQGLVVARHGVGTAVADIDVQRLYDAIVFRMRLAELIGELAPLAPGAAALETIERAHAACRGLGETPDYAAFGEIDILVHTAICDVIGHPLLLQVYDELFYYSVRLWYSLLPRLDWRTEVAIFLADIDATRRAMQRGDTRGIGFLTRNALSAAVIRLSDLFGELDADAAAPRGTERT